MLKTLLLDKNNDIVVENQGLAFAVDKEAAGIIISCAIRTLRGEIFTNKNTGIRYFETVFTNPSLIAVWENEVRKKILSFPFVKKINSFKSKIVSAEHTVRYSIDIETDFGDLCLEQ